MSHAEIDPNPPTEEAPSPLSVMDEFEQGPLVAILIGSESDRERMQGAIDELDSRGISNELRVLSAHRNPREVADYAATAALRGTRIIIAAAGMSAALPGAVAANTDLPVIGVPLTSSKTAAGGLDAILCDRPDAARRSRRVRVARRGEERGHPGRQDPRPGRRLPRRSQAPAGREIAPGSIHLARYS